MLHLRLENKIGFPCCFSSLAQEPLAALEIVEIPEDVAKCYPAPSVKAL
jgi:hypothetical protein